MNELFSQTNLPYIADNKTSLFRINRDIRFSTNKEPYKTNIGVFFPLKVNVDNIKKLASGVYMHYQPNACMAATGMHNPEPALLKLLRKKISENWYDFESLIEDKLFNEQFPKLWTDGNDLKVVRGYRESDPAFKFLKKKDITYYCDIQQEVFYTEELVSVTLKKAIASRDFSIFLNDILLEL